MTKFEKWQMDLVVAAEMAETGLTAEEVVRPFAALGAADLEQDMQQEENEEEQNQLLRIESEKWTEEEWASMMEAFQLTSFKEVVLTPKVMPDSPLERLYRSFVNSVDQLCEELVGVGSNRKEWDRQLGFIEAIVNALRNIHDAGHLRESASSFDRSLISVVDVCRTGFDNLPEQGTAFSDLLSQTAFTAAALRGELSLTV
jgi:hypothetical protein